MVEKIFQNVLILNDEPETVRVLLEILAARRIRGIVARDRKAAAKKLTTRDWALVVADLELLDAEAAKFLWSVKEADPELAVAALTEEDSAEAAVKAMRLGCRDVLIKPLTPPAVEALLDALLPNHPAPLAAGEEEDAHCLYQIAGRSKKFLSALGLIRKIAPTSVPVLIVGESGTGKELLSYYLHRRSQRSDGPYIRVNCAALSESLLESELFGHERGAFTGAYTQRKGRFERAHGGTLLLDEISETTPRLQAELLRVMEQQDFERVGGSESIRVNVRVITTSNKNLLAEIDKGRFRRDLYYRICGVRLHVPPLRERKDDIEVLVWHFVNQYAREVRRKITELDPDMLRVFEECWWPGNIRQLRNVVRTVLILGEGPTLSLAAAPHFLRELQSGHNRPGGGLSELTGSARAYTLSLQELERCAIFEALRRTDSHQAKAARLLGITDRTLREKLRRYRQQGGPAPSASSLRILSDRPAATDGSALATSSAEMNDG